MVGYGIEIFYSYKIHNWQIFLLQSLNIMIPYDNKSHDCFCVATVIVFNANSTGSVLTSNLASLFR